jgi:DNA-3-methyladenine glycosylase
MPEAERRAVSPARGRIVRLKRSELPPGTARLARYLIGKLLVRETPRGVVRGRIVETEAYPPGDPAGHAFVGMTERNHTLFHARGHAYVYRAYGVSWMLNVSSETLGVGAGVLIRAIEPLDGIAVMQHNRGLEKLRDLARGPGRLATALDIDRSLDGIDLCRKGPLWLARDGHAAPKIGVSTRIGISRAADKRLRFFVRDSPFVSGPKSLNR